MPFFEKRFGRDHSGSHLTGSICLFIRSGITASILLEIHSKQVLAVSMTRRTREN